MQRLTQHDFLLRSRKAHGKKYDYSRAKIVSATEKVTIVCPQHGPFEQAPYVHYLMGSGCPACAGKRKLTIRDMQLLAQRKGGALRNTSVSASAEASSKPSSERNFRKPDPNG
jgi:hypothetical protein